MSDYITEPCRSCGAPVIWAETERGRSMPVDAQRSRKGNIALRLRADVRPLARVLRPDQCFGRIDLRTSHFATCEHADRWRTGGKRVAS